ncbi:MAG: efflux RND transporter periplasmic adaptor subunit, partial [Isosphaeraceae bacterium]
SVFQENGHDYVWVVGKKSRVKKRQVEVATTKEDLARVESGLESGETVVLNPPKSFKENEEVRIAE